MKPNEKTTAAAGNADTILPQSVEPPKAGQLLDDKAEAYLREGGNIEDLPDAEEEQQADSLKEDSSKQTRD